MDVDLRRDDRYSIDDVLMMKDDDDDERGDGGEGYVTGAVWDA